MPRYVIAIDQGTTGSTVLLLSAQGEVLGKASREFPQHFPKAGWVEHDAEEIWASVTDALRDALASAGLPPEDCAAIGITNQRETTVLFDRKTGRAVCPVIVWQDRRTSSHCQALRDRGLSDLFQSRTGLVLDPYFSGTKLAWMLEEVDGARARAVAGELAFGTIDSLLVHRLTGGAVHITDATNASRTLLYDITRGVWDDELLEILGVPREVLPEVRSCSEVYGTTKGVPGLPDGIPIAGIAGDQQAAMFGQTCFDIGDAKCTYGTGAFLLLNVGNQPKRSHHGLLTTIAWRLGERTVYALEGSAFVAGSAVQWLRDQLGLIKTAAEVEVLASKVSSSDGVVFVPALTGLGAPYWDADARGLMTGLTRGTTAAHIARAVIEGIAFQIADLAAAMANDAGTPITRLRVDGGASQNDLMMQFQTDLLGIPIERPACVETTALGAGYLAGLAVGLFPDLSTIGRLHQLDRTFECAMVKEERDQHMARWQLAVERTRSRIGIQ